VAGTAAASTSVTLRPGGHVLVKAGPGRTAAPITLLTSTLLTVSLAMTRDRAAGTVLPGSNGVAGTDHTLPACGVTPCNDSFRGAGTVKLIGGHIAAWVQFSLVQPSRTGTPFGFAVELTIHLLTGWRTTVGYFQSGTTGTASTHTVQLNLLIDLGVTVRPTVLSSTTVAFLCGGTTQCP